MPTKKEKPTCFEPTPKSIKRDEELSNTPTNKDYTYYVYKINNNPKFR